MRQGHSLVLSQTPADWPLRGWHHQTLPSLPLYCRRTPPPPSSARHPAHASLACKLLLLLSMRGNPLVNHPTHKQIWILPKKKKAFFKSYTLPDMWAPGFTHAPKSTGSVLLVTVTMTSAPLTASSAELKALIGPGTCWQNMSARCLVQLHTRTCSGKKTDIYISETSEDTVISTL